MNKTLQRALKDMGWIAISSSPLLLLPALEEATVGANGSLLPSVLQGGLVVSGLFGGVFLIGYGVRNSIVKKAWAPLAPSLLGVILVLCIGEGVGRSMDHRRNAFEKLAERSKPLVTAIRAFEKKHGRPPKALENLVPEYLSDVPTTGVGAYPRYELVGGDVAREIHKTPWALRVQTPHGSLSFDQFLYPSNLVYPRKGFGGRLERIGDWAYVHE